MRVVKPGLNPGFGVLRCGLCTWRGCHAINDDMQPARAEHRQVLPLQYLFISDIKHFGDVPYIANRGKQKPSVLGRFPAPF
jgi:hypothetical protein